MKYIIAIILAGLFIFAYIQFPNPISFFIDNGGRFCINNERAGIMLLKNGYRAYWIRYSNGLKYPYRKWQDNLWCRPHFEKCDVRNLINPKQITR